MKKTFIAIVALIYLTVSSGFAMTIHYCMGKVSSIDLMHNSEKCGKCGKKTDGCCCKDEFKIYKLNDSHKLVSNDINIFASVAIIDNYKSIFDSILPATEIISFYNNHSPPASQGISLCILNSVFRI